MNNLFVVDTCALISYFHEFLPGSNISISQESMELIDMAFYSMETKLIFPSTIFIELYKKWFLSDEDAARIKSEVFLRIRNQENMEIQPFDKEILKAFVGIKDIEPKFNFDNHDKQILAAAIVMQCPLISSDTNIIRYNKRKNVIPEVLT